MQVVVSVVPMVGSVWRSVSFLTGEAACAVSLPRYVYHYTTEAAAARIELTQLGRPGSWLYLTPEGAVSPLRAGIDLALPSTNTAEAAFRISSSVLDLSKILRIGPATGNILGRGGGGMEIIYDGTIPIRNISRIR